MKISSEFDSTPYETIPLYGTISQKTPEVVGRLNPKDVNPIELRECLRPLQRDAAFKSKLQQEIERIEALLDEGKEAEKEIAAFNKATGRNYDVYVFANYWRSMSLEDLIEEACSPEPRRVPDITREELVEIVRRLKDSEISHGESMFYLQLLEANVPMPGVSDLVYWEDLEPEEVIARAMSYEPIRLAEYLGFQTWMEEIRESFHNHTYRDFILGGEAPSFMQENDGPKCPLAVEGDHCDFGSFQMELCDGCIYAITVPAPFDISMEQIRGVMGEGEIHNQEAYTFLVYFTEGAVATFKFPAGASLLIEVRLVTTIFMD
ncbi:hypothetical protein J25TS5_50250 [Paenibacillus faecis]|nr:hypothetical protein J25TS5_50250 [Paenibacillus faecis]